MISWPRLPAIALAILLWSGTQTEATANHGRDFDPALGYRTNVICTPAVWAEVITAIEADKDYSPIVSQNLKTGDCLGGLFSYLVGEYKIIGTACVGSHKLWMIYAEPDEAGRGPGPFVRWYHPDCSVSA